MSRLPAFAAYVAVSSCLFTWLCLPQALAAVAARESSAIEMLPRRALLGITPEAVSPGQVRIAKVIPGSSAASAGMEVGDILLDLNGTAMSSVPTFFAVLKSFRPKDQITSRLLRRGQDVRVTFMLQEYPQEHSDSLQVLYDVVHAEEAQLRSIVTKPAGATQRLPAILFIQGMDCSTIERPFAEPDLLRELVYGLTRAEFIVMRAEKSGVGDSTGTPCTEIGLQEEISAFVSALRKLKSYDFVDAGKIFLFGHSAGGWVAPLVAAAEPVTGIIVYGTVVHPFAEYMVENHRRNQRLRFRPDPVQLEEDVRKLARLVHYVLLEHRSVSDVTGKYPELASVVKVLFPYDDQHPYGLRHLRYFRELNDQNLAQVWAVLNMPVLALVGEYEIRTMALDHEYIAEIVNARHPGNGTWLQIPKMDHGFALHRSLKESAVQELTGPFGEQLVHETVKWIQGVMTKPLS